ncbi:MAG: helix-turn-helix domain-containing protein [Pseudomonadota bacterium]
MTIQPIQPHALTVRDACTFTGLCRTRLYQLKDAGMLKSFKVGGRRMFKRDDLQAFLDAAAEAGG